MAGAVYYSLEFGVAIPEICSVFPSRCLLRFWLLLWYEPGSERIVPR
jgi:hypothetical protein